MDISLEKHLVDIENTLGNNLLYLLYLVNDSKLYKNKEKELESIFLSEDASGFLAQTLNKSVFDQKSRQFNKLNKSSHLEIDLSSSKSSRNNDPIVDNLGLDQLDVYLEECKNRD